MKAPEKHKMDIKGFLDPRWFRGLPKQTEQTVNQSGQVIYHGQTLYFIEPFKALPPGTVVIITPGNWFYATVKAEKEAYESYLQERRKLEAEQYKQRLNRYRAEAEAFNSQYTFPFKWDVGKKDVLSGLQANSWGDGRRANTVNHIYLLEPVTVGRLKRQAGDFLCTSAGGNNGKQWGGSPVERAIDGKGKEYQPRITCKACLKIANRNFKNNG